MKYSTNATLRLKLEGWRSRVVLVLLLAWFTGLTLRAAYLQGFQHDFLQQKGDARYSRVIELPANRGAVADRNGEPLAISTPMESIWAVPDDATATHGQMEQLALLLKMDRSEIEKKVKQSPGSFVYLKRQIPPATAAQVMQLKIPGLFQQREYRRYYPAGLEMAHLVGFTGIDDKGQEGAELAYDALLAGVPGAKRVIKDRAGRIIEDVESIRAPQQGQGLTLSIDSKIQHLAYRELKAAVAQHRAKAGAIAVIDVRNGEILALANLPDYNPNNRGRLTGQQLRNRALTDTFEPGSTLKPFTIAAALQSGQFSPESIVQTAPGSLRVGTSIIHDAHRHGALSVAEVIQKSSNVGAAKIALSLPAEAMWNVFKAVGFGAPPQSGFPGEASGRLRSYKSWRPIEHATMAYGHGMSLSLVQLARAYMVFAAGGEIKPVSLLKLDKNPAGTKVISRRTAESVKSMLELVVQPGGTAPRAQVAGYRVAGKTGTAHKQAGGGYASDRYVSSFVGFAPASAPRLIIAVMIDEPEGEYYGGTVAAPAFANVMSGALRMLAAPYDAPLPDAPLLPGNVPELKEEA
jgi:cell division protein FtsI (penicillin-binding protein 3)